MEFTEADTQLEFFPISEERIDVSTLSWDDKREIFNKYGIKDYNEVSFVFKYEDRPFWHEAIQLKIVFGEWKEVKKGS